MKWTPATECAEGKENLKRGAWKQTTLGETVETLKEKVTVKEDRAIPSGKQHSEL